MGMTIEEALKIIKDGRIAAIIIRGNNEDETKFNQENIEVLNVIVEIMRKYQKIEQIMKRRYGRYHIEIVQEIKEVLEDGKID